MYPCRCTVNPSYKSMRTITSCERNVQVEPARIVNVPADTAVEVFPDETRSEGEIVTRWLQNVGANPLYISFGASLADGSPACNNTDTFHTYINSAQLFDCFPHRKRVCVYSVLGTTVSTTKLTRL